MMKSIKAQCMIALAAMAMAACTSNGGEPFKPGITGGNGEMLVVVNDDVKADTSGRFLLDLLREPVVGLPQAEPIFDVQTVPNARFRSDKVMNSFRNILITEVSDTVSVADVQFYNEVWAKQQALCIAKARTKAELLNVLDENAIKIVSYFSKQERDRMIRYNTRTRHLPICESVKKQWGIDLVVPNSYKEGKSKDPKHMQWLLIDTDDYQAGLLIYQYPYEGQQSILKETMIAKRDSMLKANVEGPQGSYMTTETRFGLDGVIYKYGKQSGMELAEIRGLWRMEGYAMGGPFVMRAVVDTTQNRVIVTDGYVYYPVKDKKRNVVRQLEGVMYTLKLADDNKK